MNTVTKHFLYILTLVAVTACSHSDEPAMPDADNPSVEAGADEPGRGEETADAALTGRTVMVYMVADNSLGRGGYDKADLAEMQQAVDDGALGGAPGRLLVYYNQTGTATGNAPKLMEITPGEMKTLKTYPDDADTYSTDGDRLREAVADMKRLAPARQYGIVFWSHGTAWVEEAGSRAAAAAAADGRLRSFGQDRSRYMKISTMARALEGEGLSFIYFDCCLMASVEVAYELRKCAPVIVGSTSELPADGTDYVTSLPCMFAPGEPDMEGAAKATFDHYDGLWGDLRTCTMTVVSTAGMDDLAAASRRVMEHAPLLAMEPRRYQYFSSLGSCRLLVDMAQYYETMEGVPESVLADWRTAFNRVIVWQGATTKAFGGILVKTHCGLTTLAMADMADGDTNGYSAQQWWADVVSHYSNTSL